MAVPDPPSYTRRGMAAAIQTPILGGTRTPLRTRLIFSLLLLLLCASTLRYLHFFGQEHPLVRNDLIGRQFATRAALHGINPYSPDMTRQIQAVAGHDPGQGFDYPILLAVLLAPFAALPWEALRVLFLLVSVPALALAFWQCLRLLHLRTRPAITVATILLCLCSWPFIYALRLQQPTLLVVAFTIPACYCLSRQRDVAAGLLLALATFKPQLVLPLLLWLLLWTGLHRRWKFLAAFLVGEALLLACGESLVPGWFPSWLADTHRYRALGPVLPLQLVLGHPAGLLCTAALVLWSLPRLWQLRRAAPGSPEFGSAIALVLAVTVCLAPMLWAMVYNQILLVPAALLLLWSPRPAGAGLAALARRTSQFLLLWTFASVPIAVLGLTFLPASRLWICCPFLNYLLAPALVAALLAGPLRQKTALSAPLRTYSLSNP